MALETAVLLEKSPSSHLTTIHGSVPLSLAMVLQIYKLKLLAVLKEKNVSPQYGKFNI